jgi:outer membrane translocation and assembly module TamA
MTKDKETVAPHEPFHSDLIRDYIETVSATPYEDLTLTEINQFLSDLDAYYSGLDNIR